MITQEEFEMRYQKLCQHIYTTAKELSSKMEAYEDKVREQEAQLRFFKQLASDLSPIGDVKSRIDEVLTNQRSLRILFSDLQQGMTSGKDSAEPNFRQLIMYQG